MNLQYVLRQEIDAGLRQGKLGYDTLRTASAITRCLKADMAILNNATLGQREETSVSLRHGAIKCKRMSHRERLSSTTQFLCHCYWQCSQRENKVPTFKGMYRRGITAATTTYASKDSSSRSSEASFPQEIVRKRNGAKTSSSPCYLVSELQLLSRALLLCCSILIVLFSSASPYAAVNPSGVVSEVRDW